MSIPLGWVPPRLSISRLGTDRCYERCPGHGRGLVTEGLWLWDPPNEGSRSRRGWCSRNRRSAAVILRDVSSCGMAISDQANGREPRTARSSSRSFETGWRRRGVRVLTPMASPHRRVDRCRPCARDLAHHQRSDRRHFPRHRNEITSGPASATNAGPGSSGITPGNSSPSGLERSECPEPA